MKKVQKLLRRSLAVRAVIWQTGMEAVMLTRQPMLHGYTRLEYGKATGTDPFELGVFERRPADRKIGKKTGTYPEQV